MKFLGRDAKWPLLRYGLVLYQCTETGFYWDGTMWDDRGVTYQTFILNDESLKDALRMIREGKVTATDVARRELERRAKTLHPEATGESVQKLRDSEDG